MGEFIYVILMLRMILLFNYVNYKEMYFFLLIFFYIVEKCYFYISNIKEVLIGLYIE